MGIAKIAGVVLVTAGALGLIYGGFPKREAVYLPAIISAAALALGAILLVALRSK